MSQEEVIREGVQLSMQVPRGDLQSWLEAQCLLHPAWNEEELLRTIDELVLALI